MKKVWFILGETDHRRLRKVTNSLIKNHFTIYFFYEIQEANSWQVMDALCLIVKFEFCNHEQYLCLLSISSRIYYQSG